MQGQFFAPAYKLRLLKHKNRNVSESVTHKDVHMLTEAHPQLSAVDQWSAKRVQATRNATLQLSHRGLPVLTNNIR